MNIITKSNDKLTCIDGLKGFAACMIAFVWHYQHFAPQAGSPFYCLFWPFYDMGDRLVEVFFVLSGLGMVLGYEEKIRSGHIGILGYMGKRIKKFFPLMWLTLFITLGLQCVYFHKTQGTFTYPNLDVYHFLLNLFGLQNGLLEVQWSYNSPTWYISVLLGCCAVFYFCVKRAEITEEMLIFRYIVLALAGAVVILWGQNIPIFNSLLGRGLACFFIGALLAKLYQNRERIYSQRIGYLCFLFLVVTWILIRYKGYGVLGDLQMAVIFGIAPALVLSILLIPWLNNLFSLRPLTYLGKLSFNIYLWHFPIQCVWKIFDVYFGLEINFSARIIWISYAVSVLLVAAVYEKWLAGRVAQIGRFFIKG